MDIRYMEEGRIDEAEDEKVAIEVAQRQRRKHMEQEVARGRSTGHKPKFFVQEDHPYFSSNEELDSREPRPIRFRFVEGEQGYWARRDRGDWADLEKIWDRNQAEEV